MPDAASPTLESTIAANLSTVRSRIERAALAAGREPVAIRLVAVSKTFGVEHVRAAFAAGQRDFGENRVQEALQKIDQLADLPLRWHLIGHLQSNKAGKAAVSFACIHSVDGTELLQKLDAAAGERRTSPELLVQVDLAGEVTKYGADPANVPRILRAAGDCRAVRVVGLMLLPPFAEDPEHARPYFRRLRELRDELGVEGFEPSMLHELSMGMSHDLEVAIEEGSTMVRVGTAIFGKRQPPGKQGQDRSHHV